MVEGQSDKESEESAPGAGKESKLPAPPKPGHAALYGLIAVVVLLALALGYVLATYVFAPSPSGGGTSTVKEQLENMTADRDRWQSWCQSNETRAAQLEQSLASVTENRDYWQSKYSSLAGVSVDVKSIKNMVVEERKGLLYKNPSKVSFDVTVEVSNTDENLWLVLKYWAKSGGYSYGYDRLTSRISDWPSKTKTFHITMDFGQGIQKYTIIATASLQPPNGYDDIEVNGPA